ncbi:hypothetical protein [Sphingomonas sp. Leaf67]|uniref:hypothetical protein n=1 Tax=Sphingomonas sp. Leaf67 TaxID=1736230 RepID=UPI0012E112DD|nr:hypothetical protein [Sphingomonas sp. Leaf67]
MSSETLIAYFGLRFDISLNEVEALEERTDARVTAARNSGIQYYWGNFGGLQEKYLLFVGEEIGIFGQENISDISIPLSDARLSFEVVKKRLENAGIFGVPELHLSWQPDV